MMERVALSAGRCGSECVEYSVGNEKNSLFRIFNFIMLFSTYDSICGF